MKARNEKDHKKNIPDPYDMFNQREFLNREPLEGKDEQRFEDAFNNGELRGTVLCLEKALSDVNLQHNTLDSKKKKYTYRFNLFDGKVTFTTDKLQIVQESSSDISASSRYPY